MHFCITTEKTVGFGNICKGTTDVSTARRTKFRRNFFVQDAVYNFKNVGVTLVEGIFLFKNEYRRLFDLAIWVDCSFATALARALERRQEGLSPAQTIAAYETIYFPAQKIHFAQDNPRSSADLIFDNDLYPI